MKKFFLFIAAGLMLASCSDDSTQTVENNAEAIIGKWGIESITVDNTTQLDLNDCDTGTYKEFKSDGTFHEYYQCGQNTNHEESTYTISGNTISVVVAEDPQSPYIYNVVGLDEDTLAYDYAYEDEDEIPHTNRFIFSRITE